MWANDQDLSTDCLTQLAEWNDQQVDVIMNVKCGPDTDAFCQSSFTLTWHMKWQIAMIKIYTVVLNVKSMLKINLKRLTWLLRFRHGGLSYVGHPDFSFSHTLLIFHAFYSLLHWHVLPSLSKIEKGGWAEKKAIRGERATGRVSLETTWTGGADERQQQGWKKFNIITNMVSLWQTC